MKLMTSKHLRDHNVSWFEHHKRSIIWAVGLQKAAFFLAVHSVFPWIFESHGSDITFRVAREMKNINTRDMT